MDKYEMCEVAEFVAAMYECNFDWLPPSIWRDDSNHAALFAFEKLDGDDEKQITEHIYGRFRWLLNVTKSDAHHPESQTAR